MTLGWYWSKSRVQKARADAAEAKLSAKDLPS